MEAEKAWAAYKNTAIRCRGSRHTGRLLPDEKRRRDTLNALAHRDGARCVYCWVALSTQDATLEHFIPLNSGGSNSLSEAKLRACPFCGWREPRLRCFEYGLGDYLWAADCPNCDAAGPSKNFDDDGSRRAAIAAWNKRAGEGV